MKRNVWMAGVVLTALLAGPVPPQAQSTAEVALRQAMETETIKGDLKSAIEQYRKIAAGTDRAVAAKALIRMADCHQKLGSADAQQVYQRILRDFGDQKDAVVEAKLRLAALGNATGATTGVRTRLLWDNAIDLWGSTTADGRLLSFVDWETGDLAVRDLVAGQNRRVTNKGGYIKAEAEAEANAISPDGRFIAFAWNRWDKQAVAEGKYTVRIIGTDGSNERVLMTGKDIDYAEPQAWSPDGGLIAVHVVRGPRPRQDREIALVSPNGSQMRTLVTLTDHFPYTLRFSPDGRWLAFDLIPPQAGASAPSRVAIMATDGSAAAPADLIPNANVMGWTPDGRGVLFRREREAATELFVQPIANGRATGDARRISSVSDVGASLGITPQGALIFGRTRRTIDAVMTSFDATTGRIGALTVERPLAEFGLGGTGGGVKFSPDGSKAFFVTVRTTVVVRNTSDGSERSIVPQMNRLRRLEWSADSQSLLASGLSGDKEGLHRIDLATGAATLLFESGPVPIFAPSADGRTVFYRIAQGPLLARDLTTGVERRLFGGEVGLSAVVPSRDGSKLALTTGSRLVIVDTRTGTSSVRWEAAGDTTDMVRGGAWSPNDQHVVTIASIGSGERRFELWTFDAASGPPLRQPLPAHFRTVSMSADGRQLALVRWENLQQVWTLENFLPPAK